MNKKTLVLAVITLLIIAVFWSCMIMGFRKKLVNTEYKNVIVTIVDKYYRGLYITNMIVGKTMVPQTHPAVYEIMVEYNGVEYTIDGYDTYNRYKNNIGQTVTGVLEIRKYDDDTEEYDIIGLE